MFDQFLKQEQFIQQCRESFPKWLFWLWWIVADFGRSGRRWVATGVILILLFAHAFFWPGYVGKPLVTMQPSILKHSPVTELYYSVVTFSTLGFGDVTPIHWLGQLLVIFEVLAGYIYLGILVSYVAASLMPPTSPTGWSKEASSEDESWQ